MHLEMSNSFKKSKKNQAQKILGKNEILYMKLNHKSLTQEFTESNVRFKTHSIFLFEDSLFIVKL